MVPEILSGQNRGGKKKKNERDESHIASPTGIANNTTTTTTNNNNDNKETGSWSPCMRPRSDPTKIKNSTQTTLPHFNFSVTAELNNVGSRLIILINEEINEANCMISNSAELDRKTKLHTQFGVSESHSSRDMVRTK